LLPPKVGFLKSVVDSVLDDQVDDVIAIPISIGYDRIIEAPSHVLELSGGVKEKEALLGVLQSFVTLMHLAYRRLVFYGRVDVAVAEGLSVKKHFIERTQSSRLADASPIPSASSASRSRAQLALSFGFRVLHEVNGVAAILPTIIVGTVLLLHNQRGLRFSVLLDEVAWLRREVIL
jgi:glycerol-3-phosphate O-acyltransferase